MPGPARASPWAHTQAGAATGWKGRSASAAPFTVHYLLRRTRCVPVTSPPRWVLAGTTGDSAAPRDPVGRSRGQRTRKHHQALEREREAFPSQPIIVLNSYWRRLAAFGGVQGHLGVCVSARGSHLNIARTGRRHCLQSTTHLQQGSTLARFQAPYGPVGDHPGHTGRHLHTAGCSWS